jgi:hypothetical protein
MEKIDWLDDEDWGPIDDEDIDEDELEETNEGGPRSQFVGEGLATAGLSKVMDLGIELARKQRRIAIKIVNRSNQYLTNPHWSLRDGMTEVNPELTIFAKDPTSCEPGTGEAIFRGKTLKGSLSYQIGDEQFAVMILFKVLFFQPEVHLGPAQYDDRNNQVFVR